MAFRTAVFGRQATATATKANRPAAGPAATGGAASLWLTKQDDTLTAIHVFRGTDAVTDSTVNAAEVAAGRTP